MEWFDWLQSLVKVVSTHFTFLLYCLTDQNICKIAPASQTGERVKQTFQFFTIFIVANLSLIVVVIVSLLFCIKNSTNIVLSVLDVENCNAFMWMQTPKLSSLYTRISDIFFLLSKKVPWGWWRVGRTHFYLVLWRVWARQAKCQLQAHKSRIIIGSFKPFWFILNLRNLPSECTRYGLYGNNTLLYTIQHQYNYI